jgi:hypothetical protein
MKLAVSDDLAQTAICCDLHSTNGIPGDYCRTWHTSNQSVAVCLIGISANSTLNSDVVVCGDDKTSPNRRPGHHLSEQIVGTSQMRAWGDELP